MMFRLLTTLRLGTKIALLGACSVMLTAAALAIIVVWQSALYGALAEQEADRLMEADLDHIAQSVYNLVRTENEAVQEQVNQNLNVAHHILENAGEIRLAEEAVAWKAINQFDHSEQEVVLPKMLVGGEWLGQNTSRSVGSPIVDTVTSLVGETVTIFQRMNEAGDMLRVATTVETKEGLRAVGTYIPAVQPDGQPNPVVTAVLGGETYRGRAYVVDAWRLTAYEPIRDAGGAVIGMLYVGVKQKSLEARVRRAIMETRVGETGYVYVITGHGDERGHYVVSQKGERDGENIWNSQDADGRYVIHEIVNKGIALKPGELATERYRWQNPGESAPRWKIARLAYYEPWDWVIGTSAYEDEFQRGQSHLRDGRSRMLWIMFAAGVVVTLVFSMLGAGVAWSLARPLLSMSKAVETASEGELCEIPVYSHDELGVLSENFNRVVRKLRQTLEELRQSETKYRFIFENAVEGILLTTFDGAVLDTNPAMVRMLGYGSRNELLEALTDLRARLYVNPEDRQVFVERVRNGETVVGYEVQFKRKDGRRFWASVGGGAVYDESRQQQVIQGFVADITEHKMAEDALREAYAIVENSPVVLFRWLAAEGWPVVLVSENVRQFGYTREEFLSGTIPYASFIHPDDLQRVGEEVAYNSTHGMERYTQEYRVVTKAGVVRWVDDRTTLARDASGTITHYLGTLTDITDRKEAEEALRREQLFTNAVLNSVPGLLYLYDDQGALVRWNRQHEILTGYDAGELSKIHLSDWYSDDAQDCERIMRGVQRCLDEGFAEEEANLRTKSGDHILFHFTAVRLEIDGRVYFAGIGIDVSEQRRAEAEKARLEEQLAQAQRMESIGRLAGGVAHDFNNLLTVILGHGELMTTWLPQESRLRDSLSEIVAAGRRAQDLTRQLLAFSRKQVLEVKILDLNQVVTGMEKMTRRLLGEDISVYIHLRAESASVRADVAQLEQVIMNLCVNARDAMPEGGTLTIETGTTTLDEHYARLHPDVHTGEYVLLSVSDTGCGMDEETRQRVFDPFFTTKEQGKGTGLGLATVYGIVKQHGGEILVYSEVGCGTTFKVLLPRAEEVAAEHRGREEEEIVFGRGETVLVVEDEAAVRSMLCQMLKFLGYAVVETAEAEDCLTYLSGKEVVDLLLTDVVMPGMNGRQLYEQAMTIRPSVPVLFMSGYTEDVIGHHGMLEAGIQFISKPFSAQALSRKIREVLG